MKFEPNETFQDLMGIVIETDDAFLNKVLNKNVCYKGGSTSTSVATIPNEFKPFASQYASQLMSLSNEFGAIGDQAPELLQAQDQAVNLAGQVGDIGQAGAKAQQEALTGTGIFEEADLSGMAKGLARQAGIGEASRRAGAMGAGTLGSARGRIAEAEGQAALQGQLANLGLQDLEARRMASTQARGETAATQSGVMGGTSILQNVGKEKTAREQMEAEAPVRGVKEQASIFTGIPMGQTSTTSGGK